MGGTVGTATPGGPLNILNCYSEPESWKNLCLKARKRRQRMKWPTEQKLGE